MKNPKLQVNVFCTEQLRTKVCSGWCVPVFLLLKWDSVWEKKEVLPFKERAMKQGSKEEENLFLSSFVGV